MTGEEYVAGAAVALQNLRRQIEDEEYKEERKGGTYPVTAKELKGKKEDKVYYEYDPVTKELRKNLDLNSEIKYRKIGWVYSEGKKYLHSIDYVNKMKKLVKVI